MTKKLKTTDISTLPPLRVWGVDYYPSDTLAQLIQRFSKVKHPRWSHFPTVCANKGGKIANKSDLMVCAANFGLGDIAPESERDFPFNSSSNNSPPEEIEAALGRLREYFTRCARRYPQASYFSPAQFIRSMLDVETDRQGTESLKFGTANGSLSLNLGVASKELRSKVLALLYMLRELAYLSMRSRKMLPREKISLLGHAAKQIMSPIPYTKFDPPLDLGATVAPALRHIYLDKPMHSLAVGASGVGKTYSFIVPNLKAHLGYELADGTHGAALIVDPKKELAGIAEDFLIDRSEQGRIFIAGRDGRLRLFPKGTNLSLHDRITLLLNSFGMDQNFQGDAATWMRKSIGLLMNLADAHAISYNLSGNNLFTFLMEAAGREPSPDSKYWHGLRDVIGLLQEGLHSVRWMHDVLIAHAKALGVPSDQCAPFKLLGRYASMDYEGANQISYVTGGLEYLLTSLCDDGVTSWLDLSPVPEISNSTQEDAFDLKELIDASRVIVFQPNDSPSHDAGTRLLKAQFYRAAMERSNLCQPILFLCDEFQRFITSDRESGEASFLDRCRAYRITVVLATQSVTALYDALAKRRDAGNPANAVDCVVSNIAHLFYFQTLDSASTKLLCRGIPSSMPRGWAHPLEVLPLSNLRVGEAYFLAPQGHWGRTQFKLAA